MGAIFPLLSSHIWPRIWRSRKTGPSRRGGLCTEMLPTPTDDWQTHKMPWGSDSLHWLSGWAQLLQKLSQSSLMLTPSRNLLWREFWKTVLFSQVDVLVSSVQSLSHVWLFATPWTAAHQASLSITNSQSSPKPMSIESVMPSNHLILCRLLLLLPSIFPSIRVLWLLSSSHQVAKVLEFQLQHQSFQWTPRTDLL